MDLDAIEKLLDNKQEQREPYSDFALLHVARIPLDYSSDRHPVILDEPGVDHAVLHGQLDEHEESALSVVSRSVCVFDYLSDEL